MRASLTDRFFHYAMPEPNSGCWLWSGALYTHGYGVIRNNGKNLYAHRVSYEIRNGSVPCGLFVCHKCDVPSCVNPDHLFVGTQAQNMADRQQKGRTANKRAQRQQFVNDLIPEKALADLSFNEAPIDLLRDLFSYDDEHGVLIWHHRVDRIGRWNSSYAGKIAGSRTTRYATVEIANRTYLVHRVIWARQYGRWPRLHVDHIDGNPRNNRLSNLREASARQNGFNQGLRRSNTSGIKGVSFSPKYNHWRAMMRINGRQTYLGCFPTKEAAAAAYAEAARRYHGEFARTG